MYVAVFVKFVLVYIWVSWTEEGVNVGVKEVGWCVGAFWGF